MPSIIVSITSNWAGSLSLLIFGHLLSKILSNHELVDGTLNDRVSLLIQRGAGSLPFERTRKLRLEKLAFYYRNSRNVFLSKIISLLHRWRRLLASNTLGGEDWGMSWHGFYVSTYIEPNQEFIAILPINLGHINTSGSSSAPAFRGLEPSSILRGGPDAKVRDVPLSPTNTYQLPSQGIVHSVPEQVTAC